jgi:hypothetical protein
MNFPQYITVNFTGKDPIRIQYIVRESEPLKYKGQLAIHGAPKGCKGYIQEAFYQLKKAYPTNYIRLCTCEDDRAAANQRKAARLERQAAPARSVADFLGLGKTKAPCPFFMEGKCRLNKKTGPICSGCHNFPEGWEEGECAIECALP